MDVAQFLRTYEARAPRLMWLLGAGASSAAGLPTAGDVVWRLKRKIYCSVHKRTEKALQDLSDPVLRRRLQSYFDAGGGYPAEGDPEEYSFYFEEAYPSEADRRAFLQRFLTSAQPSWGHRALAALIATDRVRICWTTNFDRLLEDACATTFQSVSQITVADLASTPLATEAIVEERWPLIAKLHGDFRHRRLKNTTEELREQDVQLRGALVDAARRFGLVVVGYSGRDASVMDGLHEALHNGQGFQAGFFWLNRAGEHALPEVVELVGAARAMGIDAHLFDVPTFDEIAADVCGQFEDAQQLLEKRFGGGRRPLTDHSPPAAGAGWPVVRLSAYPVVQAPQSCRLLDCEIGGTREVREALSKDSCNAFGIRSQGGVLAFGPDSDLREALASHNISAMDVARLDLSRPQHVGFLTEALAHALARERPLSVERRGRTWFARVQPDRTQDLSYGPLRRVARQVVGVLPSSGLAWYEGARVALEARLGRLWMVIEPTILIDRTDDDVAFAQGREFIRSRMAGRYNRDWNGLLDAWTALLIGGRYTATLRAYGDIDGANAEFHISGISGYSMRTSP